MEGFFPPPTLLLSLRPFTYINVENYIYDLCGLKSILQAHCILSIAFLFFTFLTEKKYSCYFYILHLSILAINKKWKRMFLCVLSTDKSPTHILPLVHVSFILYCSFAFCGQLHFQNGHHLLPSSGRHSFFFLFLFIYFYFHTVVSVYIGEFNKGITDNINVCWREVSNEKVFKRLSHFLLWLQVI